jgi:hypothetical protein
MKNATIATSRTRATADHRIEYRPLPRAWGDVEGRRAVRARRASAAALGADPSTLEIPALADRTPVLADGPRALRDGTSAASPRAAAPAHPAPVPAPAHRAPRRGLWDRLQGSGGSPRRIRRGGQHLATA